MESRSSQLSAANGVRVMAALVDFYLSQARFCENAARVSTDPKIIKSLQTEAAIFRSLASQLNSGAINNDPYSLRSVANKEASKHQNGNQESNKTPPGRPESKRERSEEGDAGS